MKSKQSLSIVGLAITSKHAANATSLNPINTNAFVKYCRLFGVNLDQNDSLGINHIAPLCGEHSTMEIRGGARNEDVDEQEKIRWKAVTPPSKKQNNATTKTSSNNHSNRSSKRKKRKKRKNKQEEGPVAFNVEYAGDSTKRTHSKENSSTSTTSNTKHSDHSKETKTESTPAQCPLSTEVPPPPPPGNDQSSINSSMKPEDHTNQKQSPPQAKSEASPAKAPEPPKRDPKDEAIEHIIQSTDLYTILSLDKSQMASLTSIQITKAYRRRAVLTHPDKCDGDRRAFDKVSEAYDVLSDESKKHIYDKYGLEAVNDPDFAARAGMSMNMNNAFSGMGGSFQDQILKSFFGATSTASGSFSRMSQQFRKNNDLKYELEVSLEDMYRGAHREVQVSQPGGPRTVDLDIPAGVVPGSSIRLSGMVDHVSNATPGDVVFIIRQKRHEQFTRKGHDLAMEMKISLSESVSGFEREVVHLDGRQINITGPAATLGAKDDNANDNDNDTTERPCAIQTGDVHVLKGEGMPKANRITSSWSHVDDHDIDRSENYGDLYVQYVVEMPSTNPENLLQLSTKEREMLGLLLDKLQGKQKQTLSREQDDPSLRQTQHLQKSRVADFGIASGIAKPDMDDEDDHMHMGMEDEIQRGHGQQRHANPFGTRGFQYSTSRGSSPFKSSSRYGGAEDGDVQCQQM
jgi:DnaJ-class molecular chaperone